MFNNPGTKIKSLAKTFFWIEVVGVVLAVLAMGDYLFEEVAGLIAAVIILAIGVGVAYVGALFLAAFGELVESNSAIKESNQAILNKLYTIESTSGASQSNVCGSCGTQLTPEQHFCPNCGNKR